MMNMPNSFSNSHIYLGNVIHRRFSPKKHSFDYRLFMLALDVADVEKAQGGFGIFGFSWYRPLRFVETDYLKASIKDNSKDNLAGDPHSLSHRIKNKVHELAGYAEIKRIVMLVQVRCFGIYFSPANFYFCYDQDDKCTQMLAEVSNTPWNERHYYLVDLLKEEGDKTTKKMFQVSPFMDLAMTYFWQVTPPCNGDDKLLVKIENKRVNDKNGTVSKLFDASLVMRRKPFTKASLLRIWCQLPVMTMKVVVTIYWQALKLFVKRVPFIGYQKPG
ncbi:DUF1365 domain-containing protein [Colwellia demingiae]|uniref:DUF1365 domain-containing protein n=2 Tax=Colwellia demingiae TaxID=89401 RepID=A0A5C6QLL8_9GAMM|nr:DUF1365 domain-containing protein [Colwellia demingiae]